MTNPAVRLSAVVAALAVVVFAAPPNVAVAVTPGPPSVDFVTTEALETTVTFKALVNPKGNDTTCSVEYVSGANYESSKWTHAVAVPCAPADLGEGTGQVMAKFTGDGFSRATPYRFRFRASSTAGHAEREGIFETYGIRKLTVQLLKGSNFERLGGVPHWEAGAVEAPERAGGHPFELVTTVTFSQTTQFARDEETGEENEIVNNTALNTKDIRVDLPPGLIGDPSVMPKCDRYLIEVGECPPNTQVGVVEIFTDYPLGGQSRVWSLPEEIEKLPCSGYFCSPLYLLEPSEQAPAEFGSFIEGQAPAWVGTHVRTGEDYGVNATSLNITSLGGGIKQVRVRVWGTPASATHDVERACAHGVVPCSDTEPERPFMINPTACSGPLKVTASADTWQEPGRFVKQTTDLSGFTGCGQVRFKPAMEVKPTSTVVDSPTGLHVDLKVPQDLDEEGFEAPGGLATAALRDTKVTLPAGVTLNPAAAAGLVGCSEQQIELHGPEPAGCPDASKIGTVEIDTPLLSEEEGGRVRMAGGRPVPHTLHGGVFAASPFANPFGSLLAMYLAVYDPKTGLVVKLAGRVQADPVTGRLTTSFDETPQLPFEEMRLDLFGGQHGVLATPRTCGSYHVASLLEPWSHVGAIGETGTPDAAGSWPFSIDTAPGGSSCASTDGFVPALSAGTQSSRAGSFSPFVMTLTRQDGERRFGTVSMTMPQGLTGMLSTVPLCSQAQAEADACSAASQIGHVTVQAGVGSEPVSLPQAGRREDPVYLLGPTDGAPFGLAIVVHPEAGPFNLEEGGRPVIVLATIQVDLRTAQVSVQSKPMPTILQGIPADVKTIHVEIDRPGFMLNPTSCAPTAVTGTIGAAEGGDATISSRFQAADCAKLAFKPVFKVSTSGKTSRLTGASLNVKLTYPKGSLGTEANVHAVKVDLPKQLPSNLEALKHACPAATFEANPAACDPASAVGTVLVHTQVLPVPLMGPAYFVSYGGAKFPELVFVLQGDGVTVDVHAETFIKNGITSSTIRNAPDVPFESFELNLPQRPKFAALAAPGGLCNVTKVKLVKKRVAKRRHGKVVRNKHGKIVKVTKRVKKTVAAGLVMPTAFTGQNGAEIHQNTPIEVTGCPRAKQKTKSRKRRRHGKRKK